METITESITAKELSKHLYTFSSDGFEGREVGEKGQKIAAQFLKSYYQSEAIESPYGGSNYFQTIPEDFFSNGIKGLSA